MFRRAIESREISLTSSYEAWADEYPSIFKGRKTNAGVRVTEHSALTMVAVMSCVSLIADGVSLLPTDVYTTVKDKRQAAKQVPAWIKQPNPYQTSLEFWHRVVVSLALNGNAFIWTVRNEQGVIIALFVLDPHLVTVDDLPGGNKQFIYGGEHYDRSQILHIPMFTIPGYSRGLSPIDVAREAIGLGLTAEEYGARFFNQGTTMSGIIEHPTVPKSDEAKMLREMFRKTHAGVRNSHAVGVLTGGATFKPITLSPEQAQFLETRRFQNHQIALLYHVPIYMVDPTVTSSWGSGIEEQNKGFIDYALMPYIVRIEQAVTTFLLGGNREMKFNLDAKLRPKTKDRYEAYAIAVNNGWMNLDEVRALEDMEELPKGLGQDFFRPLNMAVLGEEPPEPAQTQPQAPGTPPGGEEPADPDAAQEGRSVNVTVSAPPVEMRVEPVIHVHMPKPGSKRVVRDDNGEIVEIIEE